MRSTIRHGWGQLPRTWAEVRSGRFFAMAQIRARRRMSPLNFLLPLLGIPMWLLLWWGAFRLAWGLNVFISPDHAGRLSEFWGRDLSPRRGAPRAGAARTGWRHRQDRPVRAGRAGMSAVVRTTDIAAHSRLPVLDPTRLPAEHAVLEAPGGAPLYFIR